MQDAEVGHIIRNGYENAEPSILLFVRVHLKACDWVY